MAFPTAVNNQITDSITQANVQVLGDAPAVAMGNLYQATAQALANAAHNATKAQQQSPSRRRPRPPWARRRCSRWDTAFTGIATRTILCAG